MVQKYIKNTILLHGECAFWKCNQNVKLRKQNENNRKQSRKPNCGWG